MDTCDATTGGDGLTLKNAESGTPTCRMLAISGWGSSTYNSKVFSSIASASAPQNVGSVQSITLGPTMTLGASLVSPSASFHVSATHLKPSYAVACYGGPMIA